MSWSERGRMETDDDLHHEAMAGSAIAAAWGRAPLKLSERLYSVDWALHDADRVVGWGEYKRRSQRHLTVLLSVAKWERMRQMARDWLAPVFFFIETPERGIEWVDVGRVERVNPDHRVGGNSRGTHGDTEPVVFIPGGFFRPLADRPAWLP